MQPQAFYDHAVECLNRLPGEASRRTAISRAYYATFHLTRAYLARRLDVSLVPGGPHVSVIRTMEAARPDDVPQTQRIWRMKNEREHADYRLDDVLLTDQAEKALETARQVMTWIDSLP